MTFDVTGLTEVKMQRADSSGWRGAYYVQGKECIAKTCSSCRNVLSAEEFGRRKNRKYGLKSQCAGCDRATVTRVRSKVVDGTRRSVVYNRRNAEKYRSRTPEELTADQVRLRPTGSKACNGCNIEKHLSAFYLLRLSPDGLTALCIDCTKQANYSKREDDFLSAWESLAIPLKCYLCGGPYEHIEHLIPKILGGVHGPENTRPACGKCNRPGGKWNKPLEHYIFSVNHPTKTRAQILYEIVMSGTWPFALTTPEEFVEQCKTLEEAECTSR